MAETYPNWAELTLTDVRKWVKEADSDFESTLPLLYNMDTTDKAEEYDVTYTGMGRFTLLNGTTQKDRMKEEYKTTYEFPEYTDEIDIQRKLYDDRRDRQVMNMAKEFSLAAKRTREEHGAELFNYAFTATGTFSGGGSTAHADGKALCATDHPSKINTSYAGSNLSTAAISPDAVGDDRDAMRAMTDGRGNKVKARMDMILGPADKSFEEVAWEIINSSGKVDTADNNSNFYKGRFKLVIWDELTDSKNWFSIDSRRMKLALHWLDRVAMEYYDVFNESTQTLTFGGYMRYGFNANSWRWLIGHNVA